VADQPRKRKKNKKEAGFTAPNPYIQRAGDCLKTPRGVFGMVKDKKKKHQEEKEPEQQEDFEDEEEDFSEMKEEKQDDIEDDDYAEDIGEDT
jgi:hypothetical protein